MATLIIVEDSLTQAVQIRSLVEQAGFTTELADNGRVALEMMQQKPPDVVLTDLQMPELNGLELVEQVRIKHPLIPVVLMTAHGSEEIAVQALQRGAASYVPKSLLPRDIVATLLKVLSVAEAVRTQHKLLESLTHTESRYLLENDPSLIGALIGHLQETAARMRLCDGTELIRMGAALHEALVNAIEHGNLEVSSDLRQHDDAAFRELVAERRSQTPYRDRRVFVIARFSHHQAEVVIRDEGAGFDFSKVPDPTDPTNIERLSGRGLFLIRTFMDIVSHNRVGNEITLIKRRRAAQRW